MLRAPRIHVWLAAIAAASALWSSCSSAAEMPVYRWTLGSIFDEDPTNDDQQWSNPANWSHNGQPGVPSSNDVAEITTGFVMAPGTNQVGSLILRGDGILEADHLTTLQNASINSGNFRGTLVIAGTMLWTGGGMAGLCHVLPTAVCDLAPTDGGSWWSDFRGLDNATLLNEGTVNWNGPNRIPGGGGASITNLSGATFNLNADGFVFSGYGNFHMEKGSRLRKSGAGGSTIISEWPANYAGECIAEVGEIRYGGSATLDDGIRFSGPGVHRLTTAVDLRGEMNVETTFLIAAGAGLNGVLPSSRVHTSNSGQIEWRGGWIGGALTITTNSDLRIISTGAHIETPTTLTNFGRITFADGGALQMVNYGLPSLLIANMAGGLIDFAQDGSLITNTYVQSQLTVINHANGSIRKSGGVGTLTLDSTILTNYGSIYADFGTIRYLTDLYVMPGSELRGRGEHRLSGGTYLSGDLIADGPSVVLDSSPGPRLGLAGTNSAIRMNGGSHFEWQQGVLEGALVVPPTTRVRVTGTGNKYVLGNSRISNAGTWDLESSRSIDLGGYAGVFSIFINEPGGVLNVWSNRLFEGYLNPYPQFTNSGLLNLMGPCDSLSDLRFTSTGVAQVFIGGAESGAYTYLRNIGSWSGGGTLRVSFTNGFTPTQPALFTIVSAYFGTNRFDRLELPDLPSHLSWRPEYVFGKSDPLQRASAFHLHVEQRGMAAPVRLPGGAFQFTFNDSPAPRCVIESSEDLKVWTPVRTNEPFSGQFTFGDSNANTRPIQFYRGITAP